MSSARPCNLACTLRRKAFKEAKSCSLRHAVVFEKLPFRTASRGG